MLTRFARCCSGMATHPDVLVHLQRVLSARRTLGLVPTSAAGAQSQSWRRQTSTSSADPTLVSSSRDDIVLRAFRASDYGSIVELSRVAMGNQYRTDYLPGWFPTVVDDEKRITCVAELNGKLVGAAMVFGGVDDGRSLLFESGRIHPGQVKSGLMGRLLNYLSSRAVDRWGDWSIKRSCSNITKYYDKNPDKVDILAKRVIVTVDLSPSLDISAVEQRVAPRHDLPFLKLTPAGLSEVLETSTNISTLFPDDIFVLGYESFLPLASNVPFITDMHKNVFINADQRHGISVGGGTMCDDAKGWRYNFSYSGRVDFRSCMSHAKEHLKLALDEMPPSTTGLYLVMSLPVTFRHVIGEDGIYFAMEDMFGVDRQKVTMDMQYALSHH